MSKELLSRRAAERLHKLLSDGGCTLDPYGRICSLADSLATSQTMAGNLLSGTVPWSLDDISHVAITFGKPPGYFLDPAGGATIPSDTRVIPSEDGGENIVWRTPSGFLSTKVTADARLSYLSTTSAGYFSEEPVRTKLIFEHMSGLDDVAKCEANHGYILESDDGAFIPMQCLSVDQREAVFAQPFETQESVRISLRRRRRVDQPYQVVGRALGAFQGF